MLHHIMELRNRNITQNTSLKRKKYVTLYEMKKIRTDAFRIMQLRNRSINISYNKNISIYYNETSSA